MAAINIKSAVDGAFDVESDRLDSSFIDGFIVPVVRIGQHVAPIAR
jgi:hypothetical protein